MLTASDVGAGWTSDEQGWFLTSICDNKLLGGPRHWAESDFNRKDPDASVVSSLDSYDSASEADLLMRQARDAAGACPTFTHQSRGDTYDFRVSLIATTAPGAMTPSRSW